MAPAKMVVSRRILSNAFLLVIKFFGFTKTALIFMYVRQHCEYFL